MINKLYKYLVLLYFLGQSISSIFACSMIYVPPTKFDSTEYIFTGKIIGYTGPLYSDSLHRSFQGLIIEIVDPVYLPKTPSDFFEIVPYELGSSCELTTYDEESFKMRYPLGAILRIVGKETKYLTSNIPDGDIRLDINPFNMFDLSQNFNEPAILFSTPHSTYDYRYAGKDSAESFQKMLPVYDSQTSNNLLLSFWNQFHYELRKDLYRLSIASSNSDKSAIIKRLLLFTKYSKKDFLKIINSNIQNEKIKKELISLIPKQFEYPAPDTTLHSEIPASLSSRWYQTNGPCGGYITCIAVKDIPVKRMTIFAGSRLNGVFRSTDNGQNWIDVNNGLTNPYLYTLFADGNNIYAGTDGGAFKSTNNGEKWTAINNGFEIKRAFRVYAFAAKGDFLFAGTNSHGMFRSTNDGENWTEINNGLTNKQVTTIYVTGGRIYAGTYGGIFLSTNNGDNWQSVNKGLPEHYYPGKKSLWLYINTILMSGKKLFIGTDDYGMYFSTNFGASWDSAGMNSMNIRINSINGDSSNLFLCTNRGVFHSTDNGISWAVSNLKLTRYERASVVVHGKQIFAGTGHGIYYSTNCGKDWSVKNNGLKNLEVNDIVLVGDSLFTGTFDNGIFFSVDNGLNWQRLKNDSLFLGFKKIVSDNKNLLVGTRDGVYLSTDKGKSWKYILEDKNVGKLLIHGNIILVLSGSNVLRSTNLGESWETCLSRTLVESFGVVGNNLFLTHQREALYSTDEGVSWAPLIGGIKCGIVSIVKKGKNLFASTSGGCGFMKSLDNGSNWIEYDNDFKHYSFSNLIVYKNYIFAKLWDHGIYFSKDDGKDWAPFNYGLTDLHIRSLVIKDDILYTGTSTGVWAHKLNSKE